VRIRTLVTNLQRLLANVPAQSNSRWEQTMRVSAVAIAACALMVAPTLALADPIGTYNVVGRNIDNGNTYKGTVEVSRTGATYKVVWVIDGKQSVGTGLGSHFNNANTIATGAASDKDTGLTVGYLNKDSFGIGTYYLQPDGTWLGVWAMGGSQRVTQETWTKQ
jgi:hypothetical protein